MPLVVVESPAKAKKIEEYLGKGYRVLASYGHVRDLPEKDGSVLPDQDFAMAWALDERGGRQMRAIADELKSQDGLILATDPDREGEAISWHVLEVLRQKHKGALGQKPVQRVTFNAITKDAVKTAMANPRDIDRPLVDAYLARRALDYLFGFTLSPVLWRKLPGARSAGRVQSVALRLVVDREIEIERFRPREYWSVEAACKTHLGEEFTARLVTLEGRRIETMTIATQAEAHRARNLVGLGVYRVEAVEARPENRNPPPPFRTSTLQMEASRKLGFNAKRTMQVAQRLYEAGLITYMRTDGIDMAPEAVMAIRDAVRARFGDEYLPSSPRMYKSGAANAQEAHEAIRPTDPTRRPDSVQMEADERRLYELVWSRTLACQMAAARVEKTQVRLRDAETATELAASGQVILFAGWLKLYTEGRDDDDAEDSRRLPRIERGEPAGVGKVEANQHFTKPPPRYTEASLVKKMEELGIGRPSTYASILSRLTEREYVRIEGKAFRPSEQGRMLTAFLAHFFADYIRDDYTSDLEKGLDEVSDDRMEWKALLARFWEAFHAAAEQAKGLRTAEVIDKVDEAMADQLFPPREDGTDPRACPTCGTGRLGLRFARSNGFIGCSNYPECRYTRSLGAQIGGETAGPRELGPDPANGLMVSIKVGQYGPYVERAAAPGEDKPKRGNLPKGWRAETLTLEDALRLLQLPRIVGLHPEDQEPILANLGRFGPYVQHGVTYANLTNIEDVWEIGMNAAVDRIAQKRAGGGGFKRGGTAAEPTRVVGEHDGKPVNLMPGRYGPYVAFDGVNASLPKDADPASLTLEAALALIEDRRAKGGGKPARKGKATAKAKGAPAKTTKAKAPAKPPAKPRKPAKKA